MSGHDFEDVDEILGVLGDPGRFQILQFIVLSSQYIQLSMSDFAPIFYSIPPLAVRCIGQSAFEYDMNANLNGTPALMGEYRNASEILDTCHCPRGYAYEYKVREWSIIGDMDLICNRALLITLSTILYWFGQVLATPLAGWAADKYGRRPLMLYSNIIFILLEIGLIFSRDITSFSLIRLFIGVARQGMNSSFFVLLMEWIPNARRQPWGAAVQVFYTSGALLLILAAFLLGSWIHLQIFLAAFNIISIAIFWFGLESLPWLSQKRRVDQFMTNCNFVAKFNGIKLSEAVREKIRRFAKKPADKEDALLEHSFIDCLRTPNVRKTTLLLCLSWLSCYLGYVGLSGLSIDIAGDIYLNMTINLVLEFIPIFVAYVVASRYGNKMPLVIYFLIGGVFSIVAGTIPGENPAQIIAQNILAFISRMAFVATCCVIFVFTFELFPTVIRNNGFNLCSIFMRVGCMVTPLLGLMATANYKGAGFILVGVVTLCSAAATYCLRETEGHPLPDTIEEAEALGWGGLFHKHDGIQLEEFRKGKAARTRPRLPGTRGPRTPNYTRRAAPPVDESV